MKVKQMALITFLIKKMLSCGFFSFNENRFNSDEDENFIVSRVEDDNGNASQVNKIEDDKK